LKQLARFAGPSSADDAAAAAAEVGFVAAALCGPANGGFRLGLNNNFRLASLPAGSSAALAALQPRHSVIQRVEDRSSLARTSP
jgi:hypothetical protein